MNRSREISGKFKKLSISGSPRGEGDSNPQQLDPAGLIGSSLILISSSRPKALLLRMKSRSRRSVYGSLKTGGGDMQVLPPSLLQRLETVLVGEQVSGRGIKPLGIMSGKPGCPRLSSALSKLSKRRLSISNQSIC